METDPVPAATPVMAHADELAKGQRFDFGANWSAFLVTLNEERIAIAEQSLCDMLGVSDLRERTFLDIGSGSGLFSLAARRLGATVTSFDYDPKSVACTVELRRRYFPDDTRWAVGQGSVLDETHLAGLGQHDIVYSWGVLHHTGEMWRALDLAVKQVRPGGMLAVALYNDQGWASRAWRFIKRVYCGTPSWLRWAILYPCGACLWVPATIRDMARLRPFATWRHYAARRGMSPWHDVIDWVGGYPFEVCSPADLQAWATRTELTVLRMTTVGKRLGCNQFTLRRRRGDEAGAI